MEIILYYAPIACSLVPYVMLTEAGAPFEVRPISLRKGQQRSPDYLKLNPKHKVPLLIVDGKKLTENSAIHLWMHRAFPEAKILPADPWQETQAVSLLSWCSSGVHPFLTRLNAPLRVCDLPGADGSVRRLAEEPLRENYRIADEMLRGRDYFFEHVTAPDVHFFWCFRRGGEFGLELTEFSNCVAHFERVKQRPSVQKLLGYEQSVLQQFGEAA